MFGSDMKSHLESEGHRVSGYNRETIDLELPEDLLAAQLQAFDVIINSVAYTAVDGAEKDFELANRVNGYYAGKLARVSALMAAKFNHLSTDYVFDGNAHSPIGPFEDLKPINAYGRSKALGECLVSDSDAEFVIVRTAWLYGVNGHSFPKAIIRKLLEGDTVSVVKDQLGQPTWTMDVSGVVLAHSMNDYGEKIVHAVSSGETSWFDFAVAIRESTSVNPASRVYSLKSTEYETLAPRPLYSVLDNTNTQGPVIGDWLDRWKIAAPEILNSVENSM
jgi:dTDP-4-dehydrorhamnose reductase